MIREVWIFAGVPTPLRRGRFLEQVWNLNATDVAFMMNDIGDGRIKPLDWRAPAVERLALDLWPIYVRTHLVTWLWPDAVNLRAAADQFGPLCAGLQASVGGTLLFDVENNWRHALERQALVRRTTVLEAARAALAQWGFAQWSLRMGVTGPAMIGPVPERGPLPSARAALTPLIERCHYVLPQAYRITRSGLNIQRQAHRLWSSFAKPIIMGLSANPNVIGSIAEMRQAIRMTESLGLPQVSYWHLRFLIGNTPEARQRFAFVQEVATLARQMLPQAGGAADNRESLHSPRV